jgi:hypothetical protein
MRSIDAPIRQVPRYVVGLFFGLLLLLGGLVFSDYGVSWDEQLDRTNGLVNLRYIGELIAPEWVAQHPRSQHVPRLQGYHDNDHGVLFELPLALFDALRSGRDPRPYYLLRHGAVFLVSLGGLWALFRLGTLRFHDERLGLLAAGLLVLSPRLFGESFYNGKDVPFMAAFTLGVYTLTWLLEQPSWQRALVHALVTAAAIDIRALGLLLVPFTFMLLGLQFLSNTNPFTRRWLLIVGLIYGLTMAIGVVAGWPYLWANPLGNLASAFFSLSHFSWTGHVLYWGHILPAKDIPWHYALVWISITTPIAYQVAALVGLGIVIAGLLRQPWATLQTSAGRLDLLLIGWLVLPLGLVISLHSVLYDGWRHLYFIYPALLLLAVRGGVAVGQRRHQSAGWHWLVVGLALLASAEAVLTAIRMVWMHPHQQTYFSYLPRRQVERLFERDYWGLSFRQGLAYVVAHQPTGPVCIEVTHTILLDNNKSWLSPTDQARLVVAPRSLGQYFITTYRTMPGSYPDSVGQEIFWVRADGVKILSVFQRRQAGISPGVAPVR